MKELSYAVLGLGRYGRKLAKVIAGTGAQILVADQDANLIDQYADQYTHAVALDLSNARALQEIGLENIDVVIVDINHNLEAAIMSIMAAKELGVDRVIATAKTNRVAEVLKRIGADEVVIPEDEAAVRMARRLISEEFMEFYNLGGDLCIIKVHPKKEWVGKSIKTLNLRERSQINIIAIEDEQGQMRTDFEPDTVIRENLSLALAIRKSAIYDFV